MIEMFSLITISLQARYPMPASVVIHLGIKSGQGKVGRPGMMNYACPEKTPFPGTENLACFHK